MYSPNQSPTRTVEKDITNPSVSGGHLLIMDRQPTEQDSLEFNQKLDSDRKVNFKFDAQIDAHILKNPSI